MMKHNIIPFHLLLYRAVHQANVLVHVTFFITFIQLLVLSKDIFWSSFSFLSILSLRILVPIFYVCGLVGFESAGDLGFKGQSLLL